MGSPTISGIMNGNLHVYMAQSNVKGTWVEDNFRKWDSALTVIRQDSYGKFLEYYPPVYIIAKCLDYLRPHCILEGQAGNDAEEEEGPPSTDRAVSQVAPNGSTSEKKKFFQKINPFSQSSSDENKTKGSAGNGSEKSPSSSPEKETRPAKTGVKSQPEQPDEFYYPAEGSDIDEEDDSDMEGGYTFNHDDMEADRVSLVSTKSTKSEKEAVEHYERELEVKLMDNYVGPEETKKTNNLKRFSNRTNSLKRIFSKKGK